MPANRLNYLVYYKNESQVYGSGTKDVALATPPPSGIPLEDKVVGFITYQPDKGELTFHPLPQEEVLNAELKLKEKKVDD